VLQKDGKRVEAVIIVEPEDEGHGGAYMGKYRMVSLDMSLPFSAVPWGPFGSSSVSSWARGVLANEAISWVGRGSGSEKQRPRGRPVIGEFRQIPTSLGCEQRT
jgi:hypothetical protein